MYFSWAKCHVGDNRYIGKLKNLTESRVEDHISLILSILNEPSMCNNSYTPPYIFIPISQKSHNQILINRYVYYS